MDELEMLFNQAEEASLRTFGYVTRDLRVAHRALKGHREWCRRIINRQLLEYWGADARGVFHPLKSINDELSAHNFAPHAA